ncbi:hypothetical protein [Caballeronia sp. Lep1P3]|uniref:hypothetical protein n=1 Tax=Caballeronia sp. Lep1P3 TaxID=2878150 RepID=UPI001FD0F569|nr:hypothetical protein [Caballeronia sp. Lep1P3]
MRKHAVLTACALASAALAQGAFAYSQEEVNAFDEPAVSAAGANAGGGPQREALTARDGGLKTNRRDAAKPADETPGAGWSDGRIQP